MDSHHRRHHHHSQSEDDRRNEDGIPSFDKSTAGEGTSEFSSGIVSSSSSSASSSSSSSPSYGDSTTNSVSDSSPNFMKTTRSSEARRNYSQVCLRFRFLVSRVFAIDNGGFCSEILNLLFATEITGKPLWFKAYEDYGENVEF